MRKLAVAIAITFLAACGSDDDGMQSMETSGNVAESQAMLQSLIDGNDALGILTQVDHQADAAANDLELRPTRVTLFGNPLLGTPLMQISQVAGIDLPQKMLFWEDAAGQSFIAYNSVDYLRDRHDLGEAPQLETIGRALANLATGAAGEEITVTIAPGIPARNQGNEINIGDPIVDDTSETGFRFATADDVTLGPIPDLVFVRSRNDLETTLNTLRQSIMDAPPPLTLVAELDHSANAESVGLELLPTRLFVLGNPNLGAPLMQSSQSMAIDLPQKMLVYQNDFDEVWVVYNNPEYLAERHGIRDQREVLETIAGALAGLAESATAAQ